MPHITTVRTDPDSEPLWNSLHIPGQRVPHTKGIVQEALGKGASTALRRARKGGPMPRVRAWGAAWPPLPAGAGGP